MSKFNCDICHDTGWIKVKKNGNEYLKKCDCVKNDLLIKKSETSNIPKRFIGMELKGYYPVEGYDSQKKVKLLVKEFINDFPAVEKGILFQGNTGVGKTRLLSTIATELFNKNSQLDIFFVDWNEVIRIMRSGESHTFRDFPQINMLIARMTNTDLLLFDEIGASEPSRWVQDNIYYIINNRYNNNKITLFASNYLDKGVDGKPTLQDRIGDRIRSRIFAMAKSVIIKGPDYRQIYE